MLLTLANLLRGQVGGGWALEIKTFLGPLKGHQAVRRVPFVVEKKFFGPHISQGPKNSRILGPNPLPLSFVIDMHASNRL